MRKVGRAAAAAVLMTMTAASAAHAWIPLGGGEKPKLEIETRFMFWGVMFGRDLVGPGTPDQKEDVQDFFLRRGRLVARYRPTDSLELYLQVGQDNWGTKVATDETGFRIKDFYVNWKARDSFQVAAGQFKIPFLRNNLQSGFNQLLVDRSVVTAVRPAREGSRDLGVMAWGNAGGFQYRAALFDGSDQEDINTESSLRGSGRVAWNWGARETGLSYTGTSLGKDKRLQVGLQGDMQADRAD
ncbi:MAG TPA: porin, partial [Candidatus Polarisedimenticolia bacterium]|nr:porin [Candidatus Polarisedimenticolia bacterium]